MHYEITADKSMLHSRGQSTAFMNENLYCSLRGESCPLVRSLARYIRALRDPSRRNGNRMESGIAPATA